MIFSLGACASNGNISSSNLSSSESFSSFSSYKEIKMKLEIDDKKVDVTWLDNDSVKELKVLLPLTINMHEYGGFEQTGSIGQSITKDDEQIDTIPGDIVLYNGNAISVFYAPSSWSYTKLGHINLNDNELNSLLNKPNITFKLLKDI